MLAAIFATRWASVRETATSSFSTEGICFTSAIKTARIRGWPK